MGASKNSHAVAVAESGLDDEFLEEAMLLLDRGPGRHEHVPEFVDTLIRESRLLVVAPDLDADDIAVGEVVIVAYDGFEKVRLLSE